MNNSGASSLLLDTHYWLWLQLGTSECLNERVKKAIRTAGEAGGLLVSIMSVWEIGMLEAKGRIELAPSREEWVKEALATPGLTMAPLTPEIALDSTALPLPFHGDTADRVIVATARKMGAVLLTRDEKLIDYGRKRYVSIL